ncbi:MAG: methionyl-tRNA formyltransferase [Thermoleophilia bacterium]|nr:methionyl-tRNA formyltransferase [Thermoleophilia bacterium]
MKLALAGTSVFGALILRALLLSSHDVVMVVTQPDRPAGRGRGLRMSPVKNLALAEGLRIEQPEKISTPEFVEKMKRTGVEVLAVAAFGQILREPLLGGLPCINVHASLLPKYRGAAPIERAIMAGERETGISIMDITPKVDTGAVYMQRVVPIGDEDDAGSMYEKLGQAGGEALAEVLEAIDREGMQPTSQDESAATYIEKISSADREIDWLRPALEIADQVRGLSPHIGAYTATGEGHRLKILKAVAAEVPAESPPQTDSDVSDQAMAVEPGEVVIVGGRLFVRCGAGALELIEVQPEGKRRMDASDFIRGHGKVIEGQKFGEH